jgi:cytochrome b involved in lipid metabolism
MSKEFTANDVKEAGSVDKGLHIIIDNDVYKMDGFVEEHPGGAKILKRVGGKDASKQFWKVSGYPYAIYECMDMCCTRMA